MFYYVILLSKFGMKFWSRWSCPHPILGVYLVNGLFLFNKRVQFTTHSFLSNYNANGL